MIELLYLERNNIRLLVFMGVGKGGWIGLGYSWVVRRVIGCLGLGRDFGVFFEVMKIIMESLVGFFIFIIWVFKWVVSIVIILMIFEVVFFGNIYRGN